MALDTSIYNQLLRAPKSVAEYDAESLANQQNRLALQVSQAAMMDKQRAVEDGNRLRQAVQGFGDDRVANYNSILKTTGDLKKAQDYEKANTDADEGRAKVAYQNAQAAETHIKAVNAKMGQARDMFNTIQTPEQAAMLVKGMYADPDLGKLFAMKGDTVEAAISRIPTEPKAFSEWVQAASLNAEKLASYRTPDANAVLTAQTSTENSKRVAASSKYSADSSAFTARRGQDMTNDRAKEAAGSAKIPTGYRADANGNLSYIPGGPADPAAGGGKPATEFQGKSAGFGARAEQSDKILTDLSGKYSQRNINSKTGLEELPLVGGMVGSLANSFLGETEQQAEQAQRDFVNSILRQESGAAIGASEFDNAKKQYFPQPGDGPKVIAQKSANRKLAIQGLKQSAGKAAFSAPPGNDVFSAADAILAGGKK